MPPVGTRLSGIIKSYNPKYGYGFIKCDEFGREDVHFSRSLLPPEVQDAHSSLLGGLEVDFELVVNRDGKLRTERLWLREPLRDRRGLDGGKDRFGGKGGRREHGRPEADGPLPDLDEDTLIQMRQLLEENDGCMDHGKFANGFPGIKKAQLEPHFKLLPVDSNYSGGRWQVMLPDVEPLSAEEIEKRRAARKPWVQPLFVEPSNTLRLIGCVKEWDQRRGRGLIQADGVDNVLLDRSELPPEVQHWRGDFEGVELTFVLNEEDEGDLKAVDVHMLLAPDEDGKWQLRRVTSVEEEEEEEVQIDEDDEVARAGPAAEEEELVEEEDGAADETLEEAGANSKPH